MQTNNDFIDAIKYRDVWCYLAWQDIKLRYRSSKIGPFWITLSMGIFCLAIGIVYSKLFKTDISEYLPFLSVGFVIWGFISGMLGEFSNIYVDNANYIKDIKINPISVLFRAIMRHIIIFGHNALIIFAIYFYFHINPGYTVLLAILGFILVLLNLAAFGVILSLLGAYFRDTASIMQNLIQVIFFITPITWFPKLVAGHSLVIKLNPLAYYLDLIRSPLLGHPPNGDSWMVAFGTLTLTFVIAVLLYQSKKSRIPFWA